MYETVILLLAPKPCFYLLLRLRSSAFLFRRPSVRHPAALNFSTSVRGRFIYSFGAASSASDPSSHSLVPLWPFRLGHLRPRPSSRRYVMPRELKVYACLNDEIFQMGGDNRKQMKLVKPLDLFQSLVVAGGASSGRLLGLDVGQKYVGLAVSDPSNKVALSLSVLERKKTNIDFMAGDLKNLVSRLSLVGFIVGYPCNVLGQSSIEAVQMKLFMEDLRKTGRLDGLKFTYWDESYTSKCVQALIDPLSLHPKTAKMLLDKYAAVGILQGYLDNMQRSMKSDGTIQDQWNFDKKFIMKR